MYKTKPNQTENGAKLILTLLGRKKKKVFVIEGEQEIWTAN